jgi:AcrR family transcriptional regulator
MSKQTRMKPEARKDEILTAALGLAANSHYLKVTREQIGKAAGVSGTAVQYHFHTMTQLRNQLMRAAVKRKFLPVIAQGVMAADTQAMKAPIGLRYEAVQSITVEA